MQLDQLEAVNAAEFAQAVAFVVARAKAQHVRRHLEVPIEEGWLHDWLERPLIIAGVVVAVVGSAWVDWQARGFL